MTSFHGSGSARRSDDTMNEDTDDKDDTKRKSRNLSEKKRRDQFNMLINEISSMVSTNSRKMDKSTVLKSTIAFLKNHNEIAVRSRVHEIQEEWKPSFLSNEEFTHLILEALDGFIMVFSSSGRILYTSESITSLLGHLPNDLLNMTIYDMIFDDDQSQLYNILLNPTTTIHYDNDQDKQISFSCHCKRGNINIKEEDAVYELVQFVGYFRADMDSLQIVENTTTTTRLPLPMNNNSNSNNNTCNSINNNNNSSSSSNKLNSCYSSSDTDTRLVFVGTGRLQTPQLIREMSIVDSSKSEFTSRHSLEWKFLFLDHRAPPIIGYLPFEVLGTSGYDYYHVDDLERVVLCHEALMLKGEGTSCYYRFLTKGQQWIWLQTRFYITYHQWNSKPEFIVCTHRVVSYANVLKQMRRENNVRSSSSSVRVEDCEQSSEVDCGEDFDSTGDSTNRVGHSSTKKWTTNVVSACKTSSSLKSQTNSRHSRRVGGGESNSDSGGSLVGLTTAGRHQMTSAHPHSHSQRCHTTTADNSTTVHCPGPGTGPGPGPGSDSNSMSADSPASRHTLNSQRSCPGGSAVDVQPQQQPPHQQTTGASGTTSFLDQSQRQQPSYHQQVAVVQPTAAATLIATYSNQPPPPAPAIQSDAVQQQQQQQQQQPLLMTTAQIRLQDQLQRKHEQLQQNILQQQDELRRVSEQLFMARCGLLPQVINVTVPFGHGAAATPVSAAAVTSNLHYVTSPPPPPPAAISTCNNNNSTSSSNNNEPRPPHHIHHVTAPALDEVEVVPLQFSQEQHQHQAQLFFSTAPPEGGLQSPASASASTQQSQ